jgi:4-hydroxy-tetrahydrodipicolinate synthase
MFEGTMTALVTPFRDGAVDYDALTGLVDWQIEAGIDGLVAVGTTGESPTLGFREHIDVVARVVEVARRRVPVIAGAGANATAEALALSRAARDVGCDGLLQVVPYYNKPPQDHLFRHFETIAREVGMPVVLYNVPGRTACDLLPETVARLAEVEHIVAIKEATGSMVRVTEILASCGDALTVLSGDDFTAFPFYACGGRGVISVVSNVIPGEMTELYRATERGDWERARALHFQIQALCRALFLESNPVPVKAALAMMGLIVDELRPPLYPAAEATRAALRLALDELGLL